MEILQSLHAAYQGVTGMNERAKSADFWPGITLDIQNTRSNCSSCNNIAPSQARTPLMKSWIPTSPFEAIACDYFLYKGWYYFVALDRLSGWTERHIKVGMEEAGATTCEKSSDQFLSLSVSPLKSLAMMALSFPPKRQKVFPAMGVRHRISSAYFLSSNGSTKLAVKATKRLLMDNVSPNNDKMVRALLIHSNTLDPGWKLSAAQILFGSPLKDTMPYIRKDVMRFTTHRLEINGETCSISRKKP